MTPTARPRAAELRNTPTARPPAVPATQGALNEAQQRAVDADDQRPLLIVAGPGSGKTHVVVARIARLIRDGRALASEVLACAFTNRAARELSRRLEAAAGRTAATEAQVSTMHTACARLLREAGRRSGYIGEFQIANNSTRIRLLRNALFESRIDTSVLSPLDAGSRISFAKNVLADPTDPLTYTADGEPGERERQLAQVAREYARELRQESLLDFDDLLLRCLDMLETDTEAAGYAQTRFTHVIVDEYQDTNEPQYRIIRNLCRGHGRITVVGDPDQAIYGWRGADVGKILQFRNDYPDAEVVRLETNYRSTAQVCSAAEALMSHAGEGERLEHRTVAAGDRQGPPPSWEWHPTQADEAAAVLERIKAHLEAGAAGETRAVLYRTNAQARAFETRLRREQIPYRIIGGIGFFERAEILDIVAYLRVTNDPADNEALQRIVNLPRRSLGRQTMNVVEQVRDAMARRGGTTSTWDAMEETIDRRMLKRWQERAIGDFRGMIERLRKSRRKPVADVIEHVLAESGYLKMLSQMDDEVADDKGDNIAELIEDAHAWEAEQKEDVDANRLAGYIQYCGQMAEHDPEEDETATTFLMSLHAAKGQEFDLVNLTGCEDLVLPHQRAIAERAGGVAEERRLCYVGMTRAKRRLALSGCEMRASLGGGYRTMAPSRFLGELVADGVIEG